MTVYELAMYCGDIYGWEFGTTIVWLGLRDLGAGYLEISQLGIMPVFRAWVDTYEQEGEAHLV